MSEGSLEILRENISKSESLYDFMAYLFISITELYPKQISNLVAFIEVNKTAKSLSDSVNELLFDDFFLPQVYGKFLDMIDKVLKESEVVEKSHNKVLAGLCLVLLQNIDTWFSNKDLSYLSPIYGPLNTQLRDNCYVYFRGNESHHKVKSESFKRDRFDLHTINHYFDNFIFIRKDELPAGAGIPQVVHLSRTRLNELKGVTCACFPWGKNLNLSFIKRDKRLSIDYAVESKDETKKRISGFISNAINETDPNIIIFPEYSVSPYGLKVIQDTIKELQSQCHNLDVIIAGSTWQKGGTGFEERNNNVMTIFDKNGNEIGTYYKHTPFIRTDEEHHKTIELREVLDDPGKKITLIHLDNIGIILPSICRDMYDGTITEQLAKLFLPAYVLTVAYSHSLSSFKPRFQDLAQKFHINLVFCNYCESIKGNGSETQDIGSAGSAEKQETVVSCKQLNFQRDKECYANCERKACYFNVFFEWQDEGGDNIKVDKKMFELI